MAAQPNNAARAVAHIADEDSRWQDHAGHRIRLHPHQGRPHRRQLPDQSPPRLQLASHSGGWSVELHHREIWGGLQSAYRLHGQRRRDRLWREAHARRPHIGFYRHDARLPRIRDEAGELLVPFRTWQNTNTSEAHKNSPNCSSTTSPSVGPSLTCTRPCSTRKSTSPRWLTSPHIAGYVHWKLTGKKVLRVGDASGMFPIDPTTHTYETAFH